MGIHASGHRFCQKFGCLLHQANWEIMNSAAGLAYKMIMRFRSVIKMFGTVSAGKSGDFPQIRQKIQISVYCSQTDIGKFFADGKVKGVGSGVIGAIPQTGNI